MFVYRLKKYINKFCLRIPHTRTSGIEYIQSSLWVCSWWMPVLRLFPSGSTSETSSSYILRSVSGEVWRHFYIKYYVTPYRLVIQYRRRYMTCTLCLHRKLFTYGQLFWKHFFVNLYFNIYFLEQRKPFFRIF